MKKIVSIILVITMLASFSSAFAVDAGHKRAVIGADLTAEQKATVYGTFGIEAGSVTELIVTNSEERQYLEGLADPSLIGTKSISSVYIETLSEGDGLQIDVSNINWCTKEMYINALVTAGISDAKLIVTSPIAGISGTAALTGIYKAYEDITGEKLDESAKLAGTQELVVTAELADQIGALDAAALVNELKNILDETIYMSDEEVAEEIRWLADEYGISVTDGIVNQLVNLCRSLEGLGPEELQKRVKAAQDTIVTLSKAQSTFTGIVDSVGDFFKSAGEAISNFFTNLFG